MKEKIFQMCNISDTIPESFGLQLSICGTTYPNRNYHIYRPNAQISCLEYVVRGTGTVKTQNTVFCPKAGDTYLLLEGKDYDYFSNKNDPWEKIWINFSGNYTLRLAQLAGIGDRCYFPSLDTSDLLFRLQAIAQMPEQPDAAEQCISILSKLFFRLAQAQNPVPQQSSDVRTVLRYVEQHLHETIRIEKLAKLCQKSVSQIERLFAFEMGIPIYRYILNRKIELAKQLLAQTGMTVREISAFLSFEDEFYFSGLFRKKTGYSPTQYRKAYRENTENPPL